MSADIAMVEPGPEAREAFFRESLAAFSVVSFRVTGACMEPALAAGESVHLAGRAAKEPRFGDVVLVATSEGPRLHRLVFTCRGHIRTRGDSTFGFDGPRRLADVLGTVLGVERSGALAPVFSPGQALTSLVGGLVRRARAAFGLGA